MTTDGLKIGEAPNGQLPAASIDGSRAIPLTDSRFVTIADLLSSTALNNLGMIGTAAGQLAAGDHTHSALTPAGGTTGQVLKKTSGTDFDYAWENDIGAGTDITVATGSRVGVAGDAYAYVTFQDAAAKNYTINNSVFTAGTYIEGFNEGVGDLTINGSADLRGNKRFPQNTAFGIKVTVEGASTVAHVIGGLP